MEPLTGKIGKRRFLATAIKPFSKKQVFEHQADVLKHGFSDIT